MSNYDDEDIYIIPHNYQENGKILGLIDKQSFLIGISWILVWLFAFYFMSVIPRNVRIVSFIVVALLPAGIVFVGIGHDTVYDFVKYYMNFKKTAKLYYYEK